MRTLFTLLLVALFCPVHSFSQQTIEDTIISSSGIKRFYRVYIPAIYNAQSPPVPLVFVFHGNPHHPIGMEIVGFKTIADTANFITVYPYGQPDAQPNLYYWDFYSANFLADVNFISNLIDTLSTQYNIDPNRIYSTGASGGGFMTYNLACNIGHRIAAIASVMGAMLNVTIQNCQPLHPMPVMHVHGTSDTYVPINGGSYGSFPYPSTLSMINYWVGYNNCNPIATIADVPNIDPNDGCIAKQRVYSGGDAGAIVELYLILGGGHTWPGVFTDSILGPVCMDFNATQEIWRFLRQYRLDQLTDAPEEKTSVNWSAFPNPATDVVTIQADEPIHAGQISVADALGRTLKTETIPEASETHTLNLNGLPAGMYFISVETEIGKRYVQLVKQPD